MDISIIEDENHRLQWQDYLVIVIVISISIGIGMYYKFSGSKQRTTTDYFSVDNTMGVIPLSIAMMASHISAITMLGISGETYIHGAFIVVLYSTQILVIPLVIYCYLPVYFDVKIISVYEYLEKRFGIYLRLLCSAANFTETMLLTGVMLYAPSLALEATTGLSSTMSILILAIICTFYSTVGGIKAVLVTDVFQGLLMIIALLTTIIFAAYNIEGGISSIWRIAQENNRLNFSEWSFDPTVRHTWWNLLIGGSALSLSFIAVNQVHIQRLMTIKKTKTATKVLLLCGPFILIIGILTCFSGLSVYAVYKDCDPVASGQIRTYDKILTYFCAEKMPPGLTGIVVSGIFSASLSTISAMINALAAVALEDYVKPLHRICKVDFSNRKAVIIAKILTVVNGTICLLLALLSKTLGALVIAALSIAGSISGPILGIFTLGMFTEMANEAGTIIGMVTGLIICLWATFGRPKPSIMNLPVSVDGCTNSTALIIDDHASFNSTIWTESSYFYLYRISYLWYNPMGLVITIVIGYTASFIIRLIRGKENIERAPNLFVPFLAAKIRRQRQNTEKTTNSQLFILETIAK